MLPAQYRLRSRQLISSTIRHGRRARRGCVVVHVRTDEETSGEVARAAFAVSKAVGDSVTRHRVVRRLRAVMPDLLDQMPPGTDVVVRAMPEAATASTERLREDLVQALDRVVTLAPREAAVAPVPDPPGSPTGIGRVLSWVGWPIRSLLLGLIWVYRHTISPMLPPTCRYHPSCSAYGFEALRVHGAAKGTALTAWRVLRCNPFSDGGLDPVPHRGAWRPDIHPDGTPRVAAGPVA